MKKEHIANLAKLEENDKLDIKDILVEIEKIVEVKIDDCDIMISPSVNQNVFFDDEIGSHINKEKAFKNSKKKVADYIVVPRVIE